MTELASAARYLPLQRRIRMISQRAFNTYEIRTKSGIFCLHSVAISRAVNSCFPTSD